MYSCETWVSVRYAETDQMGVVYHGNYATYYEVGRCELLKQLGYSYKEMEADGWKMPVVQLVSRFKKPAYYNDELKIKTTLASWPGRLITFETHIFASDYLIHEGYTKLAFLNRENKSVSAPDFFLILLKPYFKL